MTEKELYQIIYDKKEHIGTLLNEHWQLFSSPSTWYFWVNLAVLIIPLIIMFMYLDRKRIFEIAFYGYSTHVL